MGVGWGGCGGMVGGGVVVSSFSFVIFCSLPGVVRRHDVTFAVDWALKTSYLPIYPGFICVPLPQYFLRF